MNNPFLNPLERPRGYRGEAGFSLVKMLFWAAVLGFVLINASVVLQAYYTNWQVQDCFDSLSRNLAEADEQQVHSKMKQIFKVQYLDQDDLPDMFYDELVIKATGGQLEISSWYVVTVWPLGRVEAVDELGEYEPSELAGMDILKHKLRLDLEFEPYAISNPDAL